MNTSRRQRAGRGEGAALREKLLVAAEELLVEAGDDGAVTVRAVAGRVGVSTPSMYLHFADRAELLDAVCLRVWDALAMRMGEASAATDDPFAQLRLRGIAYVEFARSHPVQYELLMMRAGPDRPLRQEAGRSAYSLLRECVDCCVETGSLRGDPHRLAIGLLAAVHGIASLLIAQPCLVGEDRATVEPMIDHCVRVAGLGNALAGRIGRSLGPHPTLVLGPALDRVADDLLTQTARRLEEDPR